MTGLYLPYRRARRAAIGLFHGSVGRAAALVGRAALGAGSFRLPEEPSRVVVLALEKIGDTVTIEPAVRALRARWPRARLVVAAAAARERGPDMGAVEVARLFEGPDEVRPIRRRRELRGLEGDVVTVFGLRARDAWGGLLARAKGGVAVGYSWEGRGAALDRAPAPPEQVMRTAEETRDAIPQHAVWLDLLVRSGVISPDAASRVGPPRLTPPEIARTDARALLAERSIDEPFLALAPWNAQPHFRWPEERWVETAAALVARGSARSVVVLGGRARDEVAHAARLVERLRARGLAATSFAGLWGLDRDAAILARAALVLAVDSGPAHVARAVGARTVVLFGPGTPRIWAPPGATAVQRDEGCHGCRQPRCSLARRECLEDLTAERVVRALP